MMTIVHFVTSKTFGGVEGHICTLIRLMNARDYVFKVVCHESNKQQFREQLKGLDVEVISIQSWFSPFPSGYLRLVRKFKELSPDVVHCHLFSATRIGAIAAKLAGIKYVIETIHMEEAWRQGVKKKVFNTLDAVLGRLFVQKYIAVSQAVGRFYKKDKWVPDEKIVQIYNTIEPKGIKIDTNKKFSNRIGYLGRLSEEKGVDVLIEAISILKHRDIDCSLNIGGKGPLKEELEALVHELEVEDSVTFHGFVSDKNKFFNEIDIFVLPSRSEGFSLVLLEAGFYQMPVVATNVSGNPEIIRDQETGLLVDKEDADQLASAIEAYQDKEKRDRYSKNLKSLADTKFSPQKYAEMMDALYKSLS